VVSVATVGGIHPEPRTGQLAVPDQIIDYTHGRDTTFADYGEKARSPTWISLGPYCEDMRQRCIAALNKAGEVFMNGGVYASVQGPRLENPGRDRPPGKGRRRHGGHDRHAGAYLAREIGLCYAAAAVSVNWAADAATAWPASLRTSSKPP